MPGSDHASVTHAKWKDGDTLEFIIFRVQNFVSAYRVKYYDYTVSIAVGYNVIGYVSLDIAKI